MNTATLGKPSSRVCYQTSSYLRLSRILSNDFLCGQRDTHNFQALPVEIMALGVSEGTDRKGNNVSYRMNLLDMHSPRGLFDGHFALLMILSDWAFYFFHLIPPQAQCRTELEIAQIRQVWMS